MAFTTLIHATKQIRAQTISKALLNTALQADIDQITTNKNNIAAIIASKGVASGIATLGADGKLVASQIPSIAISDFLGEVASDAALLTLSGQRGDWATVVPANAANAQSWMLVGDDATVASNWKEIRTPSDGVTSIRNVSGSVTGLNGTVTLADVAFSGAASDVAFTNNLYTSTKVSTALVEVMTKVNTNAQNITNINNNINEITNLVGDKVSAVKMKKAVALTGTIDGSNKIFTVPEAFVANSLEVFFNGVYLRPTIDYTVEGNVVTFAASADYEDERPFCNFIAV